MSSQPFSRADRNRAARGHVPRCVAGRMYRFAWDPLGEMVTVCVAVDPVTGTAAYESMTAAEHARRFRPTLTVTPADMLASFADPAAACHFHPFDDLDPATAFAGVDRLKPCSFVDDIRRAYPSRPAPWEKS